MTAALDPAALEGLPHVRDWLELSRAAIEVARRQSDPQGPDALRLVTEQNVLLQLQHLRTHPVVASRRATADVHLHGWLYEIENGDVFRYDDSTGVLRPLAEPHATAGQSPAGGSSTP